jgi:transposase
VQVYNGGWAIELQFRDVKGRPLGIQPLFVTRDDQITGLTHLILLALRIMTLITTTVRRSLNRTGEVLGGLFEGQKSRTTARPTARRLLRTFLRHEITLTRIRSPGQEIVHLEPLPEVLTAILRHLGFSDDIYTDLASHVTQ